MKDVVMLSLQFGSGKLHTKQVDKSSAQAFYDAFHAGSIKDRIEVINRNKDQLETSRYSMRTAGLEAVGITPLNEKARIKHIAELVF